jgi:large subunit ribosomal protein L30e
MIDVDRALKNAVKNGKVLVGVKESKTALSNGTAKLVVITKNCPFYAEISSIAQEKKVPVYTYRSQSVDMGYACGKMFPVSVLAVLDEGGSNIMQLVKKKQ